VQNTVELDGAEAELADLAVTRATLARAIGRAIHRARAGSRAGALGTGGGRCLCGQIVPAWRAELSVPEGALSVDYRLLLSALGEAGAPLRARELARMLGLEVSGAKIEGVRTKAKRLVERGWAFETGPGLFQLPAPRVIAGL
jgi:hypothetical protein